MSNRLSPKARQAFQEALKEARIERALLIGTLDQLNRGLHYLEGILGEKKTQAIARHGPSSHR